MKLIETTGEHLVEDITAQFTCWNCEGTGHFLPRNPEDAETVCVECNGTGLKV